MWIKDWFVGKEQDKAAHYNKFLDCERQENGLPQEEDGYRNMKVQEVIGESEKAIHVIIRTGDVVGDYNGWKMWVPKSLVREA